MIQYADVDMALVREGKFAMEIDGDQENIYV